MSLGNHMLESNQSDTQLPGLAILYFYSPDSIDFREEIKSLLAEADAKGIRYDLHGHAEQPIASFEAVALTLSGITLYIPCVFLTSLAKNLGKEAARDIWNLIRSHIPSLHQSFVARERAGKLSQLNRDGEVKPVPFSELRIRFEIGKGIPLTAVFKTDMSIESFEKSIDAIIEASRPGKRQSMLTQLCQTPDNSVVPVLVMFDEDIDAFVRIS